jgi:hypothetical protein
MVAKRSHGGEVVVVLGVFLLVASVVQATNGQPQGPQSRVLQSDELAGITASALKECRGSALYGCNVCHPLSVGGTWKKCAGTAYWFSQCEGTSEWDCTDAQATCTSCTIYPSETDCENNTNPTEGLDESINYCYYT